MNQHTPLVAGLSRLFALAVASLAPAQSGPELVQNGTFDGSLAGWTTQGFGDQPAVEAFDTTGFGASSAFGTNPIVSTFGFSALTLIQDIQLTPGARYELSMDLSVTAPVGTGLFETGLILARLPDQELTRFDFEDVPAGQTRRVTRTVAFQAGGGSVQALRLSFFKITAFFAQTARTHVDNVSIRRTDGPTVATEGERRIGAVLPLSVEASPGAGVALFAADALALVPVVIPGVQGALLLDPARATTFAIGVAGASRRLDTPIVVPNLASLRGVPMWFQAASREGSVLRLGLAHNYGIPVGS